MPVSMTADRCLEESPSSVCGVPISLLKFAAVLSVLNFTPSTEAIISFVVVLPTLPVTCTNGMEN